MTRTRKIVAAVLAAPLLAAALACGTPAGGGRDLTTAPAAEAQTPGAAAPAKVYSPPAASDFTLKIVELSRKCFGSAGCNVELTVELSKVTAAQFDPAKSYKLIYAITGAEDPYSNYMTITGEQYSRNDQEFLSVKGKSTVLTASVTQIVLA